MKKLKLALCLSTALLASSAAQAGWQGNWLVGVSGGYNWGSGDINIDVVDVTPVPGANPIDVSQGGNHNRWMWGLLGGYQAKCNQWLLGGELNVDWQNHKDNKSFSYSQHTGQTTGAIASFDREVTVGLTARLGYEVSCWLMPYIRAGIETSRDKVAFNSEELPSTVIMSAEGSKRSYRFVAGIGAEVPVPVVDGLSFRLEYDYHSKGKSVNDSSVSSIVPGFNQTAVTISSKPSHNSAKASLVFNFG